MKSPRSSVVMAIALVFVAFGAGLTWGAAAMRWTDDTVPGSRGGVTG